jgi:hypothetical protein
LFIWLIFLYPWSNYSTTGPANSQAVQLRSGSRNIPVEIAKHGIALTIQYLDEHLIVIKIPCIFFGVVFQKILGVVGYIKLPVRGIDIRPFCLYL